MNLRRKTFLVLAVVLVIMTLVVSVGVRFILLDNYEALEKQRIEVNVKRCLNALSNELAELDSTASDWAAWDDTYAFIQDANSNYVGSNLVDDTFVNLRLNIMLFINSTGNIVYGKAFNLQNMTETPVPQDMLQLLSATDFLWHHADTESSLTGMVPLQEAPLLIASKPILTSQSKGPIRGTLIMGRYLTSEEIENLEKTNYLPVVITPFNESETQIDFQSLYSSPPFEDTPIFTRQLNADTISGYALINDVYGGFSFMLRVDMQRDVYKQGVISVAFFMLALLGSGIVLGLVAILIVEKGFLSRIEQLAINVKKMGKSKDFSERLSWNSKDELSLLAETIDGMMEERINTIGELAAMIGHDLRNPLTGITSATYYLKKKYGALMDEKGQGMLEVIEKEIEYSNKIINDLLEYSKAIKLDLKETNPKSAVTEALSHIDFPQNVQLIDLTETTPTIKIDIDKMKRVFINLIKNAIDAMPDGGKLTITSDKANDKVKIAFADTGLGISEENLKKLFGPLFTTKAKGMGLGLAICKRIVEAHGGTISVESIINKGTVFTIIIPTEPKLEGN
jgi:sensor domain CHASE-containing protein